MKRYHLMLVFIGLLLSLHMNAQKVLTVPEVAAASGQRIQIPISLDNDEEFSAIQFDILTDEKIRLDEKILPTDRWSKHTSVLKSLGSGRYRVMCYSSDNSAFRGNSGNLLLLQADVASSCAQGEEYPLNVENLIISRDDGSGWDCGVRNGKILITQTPDLMVKDVGFSATAIDPEDKLECSWTVQNIGTLDAQAGFREQVYLADETGENSTLLQSSFYSNTVKIGESLNRSLEVTIPAVPRLSGNCRLMVKITPYSDSGEPESMKGNDTALSEATIAVGKLLYINPAVFSVKEQRYGPVTTYTLTRSGSITEDETFSITCNRTDERLGFPTSVTIPVGSSSVNFNITMTPNGIHDPEDMLKFSIEGNGYPAISGTLTIIDDTPAEMAVRLSSEEVEEGGEFEITVELPNILSHDALISFSTDQPRKLKLPDPVTIPAGERTVTISVATVDNNEADNDVEASIKVSCENMETVEEFILIKDDDMPELELTLTPDVVDESAGRYGITATVTRLTNSDKVARLKIFDDSEGEIFIPKSVITMARGEKSYVFSMGVNDNTIVDGDRTYKVSVAVYPSSCNCEASETTSAHVSKILTIVDDDSPHLSIKAGRQTFLEGSSDNILTVSRNVSPEADLAVSISSDKDGVVEYPHSVVIPAGEMSATVKVAVPENDTTADGELVCFKAEAEGMSGGTCMVVITDQTLPDATVDISLDPSSSQDIFRAGGTADLIVTVSNSGNAALPAGTPIEISTSGISGVKKISTETAVEKGSILEIPVAGYTLPSRMGRATIYAEINPDKTVPELLYTNNRSQNLTLELGPAFTATATADKSSYRLNEEVVISGETEGELGRNAEVEIRLANDDSTLKFKCMSDEEGKFIYRHSLAAGQTGHFTVAAGYPSDVNSIPTAEFDVYGMKIDQSRKTAQFKVGETVTHIFYVTNNCATAQSGVRVATEDDSETCRFTANAPASIGVGETVPVSITLKGLKPSSGGEWEYFNFLLTTKEGEEIPFRSGYYVDSQMGLLEADVTSIETTMQIDSPREYPVVISNSGRGETGLVTFALESWMTATPKQITSLAPGESANIILTFNPWEGIELNKGQSGKFGINCAKADGIKVEYVITPVSEKEGTLSVDAVDEFTFYTDEAPHVAGAKVKVKHPTSKAVVAEGYTNSDGLFTIPLKEGWYELEVEATDHESYRDNIIVSPGRELAKEVFMPHPGVTYEWDVEETEVEDSYIVETRTKFDVRVPKPYLVIELPEDRPEVNSIIPLSVTNKGYIKALNLTVDLSVSEGYRIEWQDTPAADEIAAGETLTFYAKLLADTPKEDVKRKATPIVDMAKCFRYRAQEAHDNICEKYKDRETSIKEKSYGDRACLSAGSSLGGWSSGIGGSGGGGHGDWPDPYGWNSRPHSPTSPRHEDAWSNLPVTNLPTGFCDPLSGHGGINGSGSGSGNYDPEDPRHPNHPGNINNPIKRPIIGDQEPPEQECGELPVLDYKLVPAVGTRYSVKGVTADGAAKVKIVLDPATSKIPNEDCTNVFNVHWELTKSLGKIEGTTINEAVYTAPEIFDNMLADWDSGNRFMRTSAVVSYCMKGSDGYIHNLTSDPVEILIFRPAVVFIHGLGDSRKCWEALDNRLIEEAGYIKELTHRVDYRQSNTSMFEVNVPQVPKGIQVVKRQALRSGIVAAKVDIIGHSMGGILARLYAQRGDHDDEINRIITVNTPHAGSELGDMVTLHPFVGGFAAGLWYGREDGHMRSDLYAIEDLAVGSKAIADLNNPPRIPKIPVYAYGTESIGAVGTLLGKLTGVGVKWGAEVLSKASWLTGLPGAIIGTLLNLGAEGVSHFLDDYLQTAPGDNVVSSESQMGGCAAHKLLNANILEGTAVWNLWHVASPNNHVLQRDLISLLKDYNKVNYSRSWFNPAKREFSHGTSIEDMATDLLIGNSGLEIGKMELEDALEYANMGVEFVKDLYDGSNDYMEQQRVRAVAETSGQEFRFIRGKYEGTDSYTPIVNIVNIGDLLFSCEGKEYECRIPNYFSGTVRITTVLMDKDKKLYSYHRDYPLEEGALTEPASLEADDLYLDLGEAADPGVICTWKDGTQSYVQPTEVVFEKEGVAVYQNGMIKAVGGGSTAATITFENVSQDIEVMVFSPESEMPEEDKSDAICSQVTLSFTQEVKLTRQAFRGTLKVNNGHKTATLRNFKLNLEVTDEDGFSTTRKEFEISPEKLTGFAGTLDFESGWSLSPNTDGIAQILFIPTKNAAPTAPKVYDFGGTISYTDPFTGLDVTRELEPVRLTVNPSPILDLTYFMQRDVLADDPLTPDVVESSEPAEFAVVVTNKGYGDAKNLTFTTNQPEIIENEKGLAIEFEIESSQLNGAEKTLHLNNSIVNDFGTLEAQKSAYAQWWLRSSLLGHFVDYDVAVTHITSYDNPDLSLIDNATIHELIHGFTVDPEAEIPVRGFLVNDMEDSEDLPDMVYFSDGSNEERVAAGSGAELKADGENSYLLTLPFNAAGWYYYSLKDPTYGNKEIVSVRRMNDGMELPLDNIWQTDRILRDGKDPLYENRIHFVVNSKGADSYEVQFREKRSKRLEVTDVELLYIKEEEDSQYADGANVRFNMPVMDGTFTIEDIALHRDGTLLSLDDSALTKVDSNCYHVAFNDLARPDGNYTLMVIPSGIRDEEGFAGGDARTESWMRSYRSGIHETAVSGQIRVWPLPMESEVRISGGIGAEANVGIYDSLGKAMYLNSRYRDGEPIDVSGWEEGVYVIRIFTDDTDYVVKAMKW